MDIHQLLVVTLCTCHLASFCVCLRTTATCGKRPKWAEEDNSKRITGGHEAKPGSWPWMTNIFITGLGEYFKCGAALISDRWVLTAAHCTIANVGPMIAPASKYPEMLKIRVGEHNMDQEEGEEQDITVKKVFLHPKWDIRNETTPNGQKILTTHDIALIELSRPVQFTSKVRSMCLDNGQPFKAGQLCYIAGWGTEKIKGPPTRILHEAALPLVSHQQCNEPQSYSGIIPEDMICAGYKQGGVDTCEGDSGGPLMCQGTEERWYLTGVASFGQTGCGVPYKYGVYTRIVNHLQWITEVTGMNIPQAPPNKVMPLMTTEHLVGPITSRQSSGSGKGFLIPQYRSFFTRISHPELQSSTSRIPSQILANPASRVAVN